MSPPYQTPLTQSSITVYNLEKPEDFWEYDTYIQWRRSDRGSERPGRPFTRIHSDERSTDYDTSSPPLNLYRSQKRTAPSPLMTFGHYPVTPCSVRKIVSNRTTGESPQVPRRVSGGSPPLYLWSTERETWGRGRSPPDGTRDRGNLYPETQFMYSSCTRRHFSSLFKLAVTKFDYVVYRKLRSFTKKGKPPKL